MIKLLSTLLELEEINFTRKTLLNEIKNVPYSNSMYGIGLILSKYNIDYNCIRLENKSDIQLVSSGILIYNGNFAIVRDITNESCLMVMEHGETRISLTTLYDRWDGVVMIFNKRAQSGEANYYEHMKKEKANRIKAIGASALCASGILFIIMSNVHHYNTILCLIIMVNLIGIGVSYLLLQKQLHIPNKVADKLCELAKESHCDDVIQSDGATLFGLFKLSEVGTAFFCINFLALLCAPIFANTYAVIAALVLPFSFWSIWYQKVKAKSWCILCLITLATMWTQAILYIIGGYYTWSNNIVPVFLLICASYGLGVITINKLMELIESKQQESRWQKDFQFLKHQDYVIDSYVKKSIHYDNSPANCSSLIFGDKDAPRLITIFSNPYCTPCANMHKQIVGLPGKNVKVQYVLTSFSSDRSIINKYIIAAYQQLGASRTWQLLSDWYDGGKQQGEAFFKPFNLNIAIKDVESEFDKHKKWSNNDNLYGTPTVLCNGITIEYPYVVSDYMVFPGQP